MGSNVLVIIVFVVDNRFLELKSVLSIHILLFPSYRTVEEETSAENRLRAIFSSKLRNKNRVWENIETSAKIDNVLRLMIE